MTFWIILILMVVAGLALLIPTLLGNRKISAGGNREQNISIAQERMSELKKELESGALTEEVYQQTLEELEKSLLIDVAHADQDEQSPSSSSAKMVFLLLIVVVPVLSFGLYDKLGSPQYLDIAGPGAHPVNSVKSPPAGELPSVEEMITGLKKKTIDNPADPDAWYLLGRLYAASGQFTESVKAYEQLVVISGRQPTALVVLADSLAMTKDGDLSGRPISLVMEAIAKEPAHTTALWMAGQAAADQKDYLQAITYWQRASQGLQENKEMFNELQSMISEAVDLAKAAGMDVAEPDLPELSAAVSIAIEVTIDPELLKKINENDVLFIFARATTGPPMPVAAIKRQARELPVSLILDDSFMLRAGSSLAKFDQLKLGARVSHSGQPIGQSGDWQSEFVVVKTAAKDVILLHINQLLP